jgi:hypothetical protein
MTTIIAFTLILEYILFQILILSINTWIQVRGLRGIYPLWMFFSSGPCNSLFQTARGSGAYTQLVHFLKVHITREFFRAPHGFTHESTRTTLVSTRQYLGATRRLPSPTMICSGAWRYRDGTRMGLGLDYDLLRDTRQGGMDFKHTRST